MDRCSKKGRKATPSGNPVSHPTIIEFQSGRAGFQHLGNRGCGLFGTLRIYEFSDSKPIF